MTMKIYKNGDVAADTLVELKECGLELSTMQSLMR